jgi:hypothetical protein
MQRKERVGEEEKGRAVVTLPAEVEREKRNPKRTTAKE